METAELIRPIELTASIRNNLVKERRVRLGLSQMELGRIVGIGQQVSAIECFRHNQVSAKALHRLAEFFECAVEDIYPGWMDKITNTRSVRKLSEEQLPAVLFSEAGALLSQCPLPDDEYDHKELTETASRALEKLRPRERQVVCLRFGLDGEDEHALENVARRMDVSRERIRQIEAKVLRKLRHPSNSLKQFA